MSNKENPINVIVIMTDQHRGDCLGVSGHPVVETPHLDSLAADGINFTNGYSACPSCIPARGVFMTGQTPWNLGILGMGEGQSEMRTDYPHTMPGELAKAGYHTQLVGKMHFTPHRALNGFHNTVLDEHEFGSKTFISDYQRYFERNAPEGVHMREHLREWNATDCRPFFLPEHLHPTNWTARESIAFIERRDPSKPFFLCSSFIRPHSPYDPPQYFWDMYENKDIPEPNVGDWADIHETPSNRRCVTTWHGKKTASETRRARVGYYAAITHIDNQVGNLLTYLKENELYHNSLIIFTSDHGDMMGDHNMWRKTYAYEGSVKIPFIVKLPSCLAIPGNLTNEQPVELRDIMATVLDVCGVAIPKTVDGISLLRAAKGEKIRDYLHGEHCNCYSASEEMQYTTDGKRKYIWFPRTGREQFFDLERDHSENKDLIMDESYQAEITKWRQYLITELEERNAGLVKNGELVIQDGPIISPYRDVPRTEKDVSIQLS